MIKERTGSDAIFGRLAHGYRHGAVVAVVEGEGRRVIKRKREHEGGAHQKIAQRVDSSHLLRSNFHRHKTLLLVDRQIESEAFNGGDKMHSGAVAGRVEARGRGVYILCIHRYFDAGIHSSTAAETVAGTL